MVVFSVSGTHKNHFHVVGKKTKDSYRFQYPQKLQVLSMRSLAQFAFAADRFLSAAREPDGNSRDLNATSEFDSVNVSTSYEKLFMS